jgi:FKBP-type peptidyl-prolyl cis-trans isomerase SlpA
VTQPIQAGSRVTLHYTVSFKDGTVVDSTAGGEPARASIGAGELLELLEQRLLGHNAGEHLHYELSAEETRLPSLEESVQRLPRADFPFGLELKPGELIGFETPNGEEVPGLVLAVTDTEVTVDFSHPLAGRDLVFDVEILAVEPA